jgi:hypothetical protein
LLSPLPYAKAFDAAREVLGLLTDPGLRGYRALWHYLASSAAQLAANDGDAALQTQAGAQYRQAKEASSGITWLVALARGGGGAAPSAEESKHTAVMLQAERLEAYLHKLGTVHNRAFSAREKQIREGLAKGAGFEAAQVLLGEHLGFEAGKKEEDASPDPWWRVGEFAFVFEDHANAGADAVIDATKARQAASHPDWLRDHVPGTAGANIQAVLVSPAGKAKKGAMPHLGRVAFWGLDDFRRWADSALEAVRELRREYDEPGEYARRGLADRRSLCGTSSRQSPCSSAIVASPIHLAIAAEMRLSSYPAPHEFAGPRQRQKDLA